MTYNIIILKLGFKIKHTAACFYKILSLFLYKFILKFFKYILRNSNNKRSHSFLNIYKRANNNIIILIKIFSFPNLYIVYTHVQEWNDYNLQWNKSEYPGVKDLRITPNKLWKPDVLMYNR